MAGPAGETLHVHACKERTLVLDFIDAGTRQLAWRGWGTGIVDDLERMRDRLDRIVPQILAKFPPG